MNLKLQDAYFIISSDTLIMHEISDQEPYHLNIKYVSCKSEWTNRVTIFNKAHIMHSS